MTLDPDPLTVLDEPFPCPMCAYPLPHRPRWRLGLVLVVVVGIGLLVLWHVR